MIKSKQQNMALKLLKGYRAVLWRKSVLEVIPRTNNKTLLACLEQIKLTNELVEALKNDNHSGNYVGDKMYWILQSTFMTNKQPGDIAEILDDIAKKYEHIPRRTYFRLKKQAIERLDECLEKMVMQDLSIVN